VFTPVLAKHSKSFNLIDTLSVGVDRIQRNFEPLQRQVEHWRQAQLTDERAKLIFYAAFIDGKLDAPRSLLSEVHRLYFEPQYEEFSPRTMWSSSNALTSAFKKLDPVPQFKATAKLGIFESVAGLIWVVSGHTFRQRPRARALQLPAWRYGLISFRARILACVARRLSSAVLHDGRCHSVDKTAARRSLPRPPRCARSASLDQAP
jgi:hypothetical protein